MATKKPDRIVFDDKSEKYDAALKPYATDLAAPAIKAENLAPWKNRGVRKVNAALSAEFEEIKEKYQRIKEKFEYNELVYSSKFNFEPIVGHTYHLYRDKENAPFLSILKPEECNFDHVGSFQLASDYVWEKVK